MPLLVVVIGALLWARHPPQVADLAAQTGWAQLVRRSGDVVLFARWYGGVPTGGYSLTTPVLMATLGIRTVAVLAAVGTVAVAGQLLRGARHPLLGTLGFALAALADLLSGRVTFAVGGVLALAAVLAADRRRPGIAAALAVLATVTSGVTGLFLLIPAAVLLAGGRRREAIALGAGSVAALAAVSWAFPVGGYEPFAGFVLRPALLIPLVAACAPLGRRVRLGLLLTAGAVLAAYLVHSPLGSNVTRLSILVVIPVLLAASRVPFVSVPLALVLGIWPWHQLHDDLVIGRQPPAAAAFDAGLVRHLAGDRVDAAQRVEVLEPRPHWAETRLAQAGVTPARGWVRQLDERLNPLFFGRAPLTAGTYRSWLDAHGVATVAVPRGVPLDFSATAEARLIGRGLPYLKVVWSDPHWTVYAVADPAPVATGVARVTRLTDTGADLTASSAGSARLSMRWSPYLVVSGGTVSRDRSAAGGDGVLLHLDGPGPHRLHAVWRWP